MIDGGLRKTFRERLRSGWHWQSVETGGTGLGIPDSNFCVGGVEGWVEYKRTEAWAVDLSPEQIGWHLHRNRVGGRTFIAVRRQHSGGPRKGPAVDELWLVRGSWAGRLGQEGLPQTEADALVPSWIAGRWGGGPARWDWDTIGGIISLGRHTKKRVHRNPD
jgi:hypothetical protein